MNLDQNRNRKYYPEYIKGLITHKPELHGLIEVSEGSRKQSALNLAPEITTTEPRPRNSAIQLFERNLIRRLAQCNSNHTIPGMYYGRLTLHQFLSVVEQRVLHPHKMRSTYTIFHIHTPHFAICLLVKVLGAMSALQVM